MRILLSLVIAAIPLAAQNPVVELLNTSRPGADFQVGDRFEIVITGLPDQAVSVRTTMQGRTDWGPILGYTDPSAQWSTSGVFGKADFGSWRQVWTVGGKVANPVLSFSVTPPCIPGGQGFINNMGRSTALTCDTATGSQSFVTPSDSEPFRTPDGRIVPGRDRSTVTAEQLHIEIMESLIGPRSNRQPGKLASEAAALITKMIGINALTADEIRNVLSIIRASPVTPSTLPLLRHLAEQTDQASLKKQISETIASIRRQ